jgi:hypothetical protein
MEVARQASLMIAELAKQYGSEQIKKYVGVLSHA